MKSGLRGLLLGVWIMIAIWMGVIGFDYGMVVLGAAWILIAPWVSQRCLWFSPDVLLAREELLAMLFVSGVVVTTGAVWIMVLGYSLTFVSLLIWTLGVVTIGCVIEWVKTHRA